MAVKLTTTKKTSSYIKALVYAESGTGKTWLCQTAPKPLIISAEEGLLTLKDVNIPVVKIQSLADLEETYDLIMNDPRFKKFETICLDSISDIGETVLAEEKKTCGADPRKAYGSYVDKLLPLIKKFRDIEDKHLYFTAKLKRYEDSFSGITTFGPSMPGQQLGAQLPYLFDFVLALLIGEDDDGARFRYLQTESTIQRIAKARGGMLDETEPPDLDYIFRKALGKLDSEEIVETKKVEEIKEVEQVEDQESVLEDEEVQEEAVEEVSEEVQEDEPEEVEDTGIEMDEEAEAAFAGE